MTDEAYVFKQTSMERKRDGRGYYNKVKRGGRIVRFPSDNLTRKERNDLDGDVNIYPLNEPVEWKRFQKWPTDVQIEYLKRLDGMYRPTAAMYAQLFGTTSSAVAQHRARIRYQTGKYHGGTDKAGFAAFCRQNQTEQKPAEKPIEEKAKKADSVKPENLTADHLYALLAALGKQGIGAKITIEVQF